MLQSTAGCNWTTYRHPPLFLDDIRTIVRDIETILTDLRTMVRDLPSKNRSF